MELFAGGELDHAVMERTGCIDYSCSPWDSEKPDVFERQIYYRFDKSISRYRGEVTSTQQKTPLSNGNGWLLEEVMTLHGVPLGDYFNVYFSFITLLQHAVLYMASLLITSSIYAASP